MLWVSGKYKKKNIFLYVFSADPQRLFLLLDILVSVQTFWTQGTCIYFGVGTDSVDSRELSGMGT